MRPKVNLILAAVLLMGGLTVSGCVKKCEGDVTLGGSISVEALKSACYTRRENLETDVRQVLRAVNDADKQSYFADAMRLGKLETYVNILDDSVVVWADGKQAHFLAAAVGQDILMFCPIRPDSPTIEVRNLPRSLTPGGPGPADGRVRPVALVSGGAVACAVTAATAPNPT
jgi:hypothetical protein